MLNAQMVPSAWIMKLVVSCLVGLTAAAHCPMPFVVRTDNTAAPVDTGENIISFFLLVLTISLHFIWENSLINQIADVLLRSSSNGPVTFQIIGHCK